jgi:hypothetical protein
MSKYEQESKKDIEKILKLSNKAQWGSLTSKERELVVSKYYDLRSIKSVGIQSVLNNNRDVMRSMALLVMGLLLGIFGGVASDVLMKYLPSDIWFDVVFLLFCLVFIIHFFHFTEKIVSDNLREDNVLGHLLDLVKEDLGPK